MASSQLLARLTPKETVDAARSMLSTSATLGVAGAAAAAPAAMQRLFCSPDSIETRAEALSAAPGSGARAAAISAHVRTILDAFAGSPLTAEEWAIAGKSSWIASKDIVDLLNKSQPVLVLIGNVEDANSEPDQRANGRNAISSPQSATANIIGAVRAGLSIHNISTIVLQQGLVAREHMHFDGAKVSKTKVNAAEMTVTSALITYFLELVLLFGNKILAAHHMLGDPDERRYPLIRLGAFIKRDECQNVAASLLAASSTDRAVVSVPGGPHWSAIARGRTNRKLNPVPLMVLLEVLTVHCGANAAACRAAYATAVAASRSAAAQSTSIFGHFVTAAFDSEAAKIVQEGKKGFMADAGDVIVLAAVKIAGVAVVIDNILQTSTDPSKVFMPANDVGESHILVDAAPGVKNKAIPMEPEHLAPLLELFKMRAGVQTTLPLDRDSVRNQLSRTVIMYAKNSIGGTGGGSMGGGGGGAAPAAAAAGGGSAAAAAAATASSASSAASSAASYSAAPAASAAAASASGCTVYITLIKEKDGASTTSPMHASNAGAGAGASSSSSSSSSVESFLTEDGFELARIYAGFTDCLETRMEKRDAASSTCALAKDFQKLKADLEAGEAQAGHFIVETLYWTVKPDAELLAYLPGLPDFVRPVVAEWLGRCVEGHIHSQMGGRDPIFYLPKSVQAFDNHGTSPETLRMQGEDRAKEGRGQFAGPCHPVLLSSHPALSRPRPFPLPVSAQVPRAAWQAVSAATFFSSPCFRPSSPPYTPSPRPPQPFHLPVGLVLTTDTATGAGADQRADGGAYLSHHGGLVSVPTRLITHTSHISSTLQARRRAPDPGAWPSSSGATASPSSTPSTDRTSS
jgi:hypothetical protein